MNPGTCAHVTSVAYPSITPRQLPLPSNERAVALQQVTMVNYGVSRACGTCRKRKLKCDEGRPEIKLRRYVCAVRSPTGSASDTETKRISDFVITSSHVPLQEGRTDFQHVGQDSLETFLKDYAVVPANPILSRGFMHRLPSLLVQADRSFILARAAQLVANASLANRTSDSNILHEARRQYVCLLRDFHHSLSHIIKEAPIEALATVVLLGLYEIVTSDGNAFGHVAHVRGIGAILTEEASPFDLHASTHLFKVANPLVIKHPLGAYKLPSVLGAPGSHESIESLDSILVQCQPLFLEASAQLQRPNLPQEALECTFEHALEIEKSFSQWDMDHSGFWKASPVGFISRSAAEASSCAYCRSGPVHTYLDAVINTYRKTRLMLLEILSRMARQLGRSEVLLGFGQQSSGLIEHILASIPYHLASDPQAYLTLIDAGATPPRGRPVGGLLLLHPLYVLPTSQSLSGPAKTYVLDVLAWIGEHMGIGQATMMAKLLHTTKKSRVLPADAAANIDAEVASRKRDRMEVTVVGWYSDDDPENPHNWSFGKKLWVAILLFVYTFSVYIGSSLYTASEDDITQVFGISDVAASLALALNPSIGRMPLYVVTFFIFVVLCVPMALVDNLAGVLMLRFLLGFFGSPCLATAGASYGDFFFSNRDALRDCSLGRGCNSWSAWHVKALGPLVGAFAVQAKGWRWSSWELLWLSAPTMVLMFFSMPETSSENILLKRAQRLRRKTLRPDLKSESEIRQARMDPRQVIFDALIKPWEMNALDPASFFECFPLVYEEMYNFNLGQLGLAFLSVLCGLCVAVCLLCAYFYYLQPKRLAKFDTVPPEARIWPGLFATFLIPIGLYLFAWTARPSLHWIISMIGIAISMCGVFVITQCMFIYLPFTYPRYAGSLFAANGFARSLLAAASILFSTPHVQCHSGIGWG
ncbi:cycloheximide resistance protein [Penicillium chermesinum]|uniref:Cycloheximide resistance protein n=1 Tax=Penicillium chermesinum TaxID=63820 RepID=A0A9W9TQC1_9EURO|nr:cycloheximide resistance protein [Penicillium chermesinum]KAJ5233154.1 cycloheximide resistance protein [Penicillium chermesinum]